MPEENGACDGRPCRIRSGPASGAGFRNERGRCALIGGRDGGGYLEVSQEDAFKAAHIAEIENKSGMGDVSALYRGGVTLRRVEGLPPFGKIDRIANYLEIVCATIGPPIHTLDVLSDPIRRSAVNAVGKECCDMLAKDPTMENLFSSSRTFAFESGIASPWYGRSSIGIGRFGDGSMIMLGNSVFATGDMGSLENYLSGLGTTYRLRTDIIGPRVLVVED